MPRHIFIDSHIFIDNGPLTSNQQKNVTNTARAIDDLIRVRSEGASRAEAQPQARAVRDAAVKLGLNRREAQEWTETINRHPDKALSR